MKKQVEMSVTINGKDVLAYPYTEKDYVQFENGSTIDEILENDLASPTVTHDETSFKVGVGDSDVSSSIVDSSVGKMVIKGQTYQNILPEPTLRNEMQGKSMQRLNEGYDSIETVDGVSKSAILKGQTLVNLANYELSTSSNELLCSQDFSLQKNNTAYTLFNFTDKIITFNTYTTSSWRGFENVGANSKKLLTLNNFTIKEVIGRAANGWDKTTETEKFLNGYMIIEGDYTNVDIPYFTGMQSVKMPVLKTTGKNLCKYRSDWVNNGLTFTHTNDGVTVNGTATAYVDYYVTAKSGLINVETIDELNRLQVGTRLFLSNNLGKKSYISYTLNGETKYTDNVTIQNGMEIIGAFVRFQQGDICNNLNLTIQLEIGNEATPYEPHKSNILSCQLAPLNQSMFEQGTFAESTPPNTQSYESIKLGSEHLYTTRIRTKSTYKVVRGATYEVQLNDGYGIYVCYCKNGLYSATVNRWLDGTSTFTVPNDCDEMFFAIRKTDNTTIAPSDYPHIGLKIHQKVVLRSLPNGVTDTLNINTGEYVQRIGEIVLDGSQRIDAWWNTTSTLGVGLTIPTMKDRSSLNCDKLPVVSYVEMNNNTYDKDGIASWDVGNTLRFRILKSKLSTEDINGLKLYLQANPITVQYELTTPTIKTVDLSSHGNWEKVVLDGSENWTRSMTNNNYFMETNISILPNRVPNVENYFIHDSSLETTKVYTSNTNIGICIPSNGGIRIRTIEVQKGQTLEEFKQYLSQNPITVWYQTTTTQDNSIREMLSFANGHLQVSNEAENSLLPSVQYEIPTKNSYHMDLMKTNTLYTMKAKSVSGTFTIDGTSYNVDANGTFTSPSSMTDKLLIMSNKTNEEVMVLEGNVVDKTIPYFKGIKSAFEGEDKIEVLSTGKNLLDNSSILKGHSIANATVGLSANIYSPNEKRAIFTKSARIKVGKKHYIYCLDSDYSIFTPQHDENGIITLGSSWKQGVVDYSPISNFMKVVVKRVDEGVITEEDLIKIKENIIICECEGSSTYEPYKSNSTKIPLLHPLRSLPNGVCDELIIDRLNHKAKLIQRVGCSQLKGNAWTHRHAYSDRSKDFSFFEARNVNHFKKPNFGMISPQFPTYQLSAEHLYNETRSYIWCGNTAGEYPYAWIETSKLATDDVAGVKRYFDSHPLDLHHELATPIITEIDLEGYPYAYKDGHIFLNSDIAPTTEITYSINQAQQIESANENLQRHEKEISHLQKLIAQYIQVEYESTLLSLKI